MFYRTKDPEFKKRITKWINVTDEVLENVAIIEYSGKVPKKFLPHENSKNPAAPPFCRTPQETQRAIKKGVSKHGRSAYRVYTQLLADGFEPSTLKSVQHQKEIIGETSDIKKNPAEAFMEINMNMMRPGSGSLIQEMVTLKGRHPSPISYTDQGKKERFCHRTFNLGDFYITTIVLQHPNLYTRNTTTHPALLSALYMHEKADKRQYKCFLAT